MHTPIVSLPHKEISCMWKEERLFGEVSERTSASFWGWKEKQEYDMKEKQKEI